MGAALLKVVQLGLGAGTLANADGTLITGSDTVSSGQYLFEPGRTQQLTNNSRQLIETNLWHLPPPMQPSTHIDVQNWMFQQAGLRLPVVPWLYQHAFSDDPQLAQEHLTPTDGSAAPCTFSHLLHLRPVAEWLTTEAPTFVTFLTSVWRCLDILPNPLQWTPYWNATEKHSSHSSNTQKPGRRPDTMIVIDKCTMLLGEDKCQDIQQAFADLNSKRASLCRLHYQHLPFLLGYAAAGPQWQWCILPANANEALEPTGLQLLNLCRLDDSCQLLLSLVQAYCLLQVMVQNLASMPHRMRLYEKISRGTGRQVLLSAAKAYNAANEAASQAATASQEPFLITSSIGPSLSTRSGRYTVHTAPCRWGPRVSSEKDNKGVALAYCQAAQILHSKGLVHRDLRWGNILQIGPSKYMVIDLESAAAALPLVKLPQSFANILRTCTQSALDEGCYTTRSDMYSIGVLLEEACGRPSQAGAAFIRQLKQKALSAAQALHSLQTVWTVP
ncbi:hypothetical protein WJX74_002569 [Apatococcus lobatus]|uniref:Serine-threonine/tyrosine-protein kinase catalytic domain-containing protein n=1 Tax=Apatococcus lobatus TaxID=904363 RepID=A0AAW1S2I0_9CHLO